MPQKKLKKKLKKKNYLVTIEQIETFTTEVSAFNKEDALEIGGEQFSYGNYDEGGDCQAIPIKAIEI